MTSLWRLLTSLLRGIGAGVAGLVPNDEQMESAENEKREKALTDFLNRQETARAQRQQLRELRDLPQEIPTREELEAEGDSWREEAK